MRSFLKNFIILLVIAVVGIGIYYYFNGNSSGDDKTNIENTVQSETASSEEIQGTVVAKRSTENN